MTQEAPLARAYALLRRGQLADAEALCRATLEGSSGNATALHLLGLIRKDAGDTVAGERLLRESIAAEPSRAEFRANLANLLRRLGRLKEAERSYRDALGLDPEFRPARLGLARTLHELGEHAAAESEGRVLVASHPRDCRAWAVLATALRDQNRLAEAELAYRTSIEAQPAYAPAHLFLGALLSQADRAEEALEALTRAQSLGIQGFELAFHRGRALLGLYRIDEAELAFAEAVALRPLNAVAQANLARVRFMRDAQDFARDITAVAVAHRDEVPVQLLLATVLQRTGDLAGAEASLRQAIERNGALPQLRTALANVLHETGALKEAETEALEAATASPNDSRIVENLVAILLARGKPDDAEPFIQAQRARNPLDQAWLAWEASGARLLGQPRYRELFDYQRLVCSYRVEPPPGWSSMAGLNIALVRALDSRHRFATLPLDESLRCGSLTTRSLLTEREPAFQAIIKAFEGPIESYRQAVGADPAHPLSARNRGKTRYTNVWSVRLQRGGFHVNHVHSTGWISAVYYVSVPDDVADVKLMSGWLKFGEPRDPVPGASPECFIKPQPGLLVLFPSYMWSGTNPIRGPVPCTTIGFVCLPAEA